MEIEQDESRQRNIPRSFDRVQNRRRHHCPHVRRYWHLIAAFVIIAAAIAWYSQVPIATSNNRLASYLSRKANREPNWSTNHQDYEQPLLVILLIFAGLMLTALLVSVYWKSQDSIWSIAMEYWERGRPWNSLAPCIMGMWLVGLVVCGAPAVALPALAICAP